MKLKSFTYSAPMVAWSVWYTSATAMPRDLRFVSVDRVGQVTGDRPVALDLGQTTFSAMAALPDGGCVLAGTYDNRAPGHLDGLLVRLDAAGSVVWRRTVGSAAPERVSGVACLADGGFVLAGETGLAAEGELRPWVARLDGAGRAMWQTVLPGPVNARALAAVGRTDGGLAVLRAVVEANGESGRSAVTGLDASGRPTGQERWLAPDETASALARSPDGNLVVAGSRRLPGGNPNLLPPRQALLVKLAPPGP